MNSGEEFELAIHKLINENQIHPAQSIASLTSMLAYATFTFFVLTGTDLTERIIVSYRETTKEIENSDLVEKYKEKCGLKK